MWARWTTKASLFRRTDKQTHLEKWLAYIIYNTLVLLGGSSLNRRGVYITCRSEGEESPTYLHSVHMSLPGNQFNRNASELPSTIMLDLYNLFRYSIENSLIIFS